MGSLTDFLFEGTAPPATTQYGIKTDNIPQWMSDYTQGLVARANAIAAEPYQTYGGPRIAGFTNDTQNAFNMTRQAANSYQSPLSAAMGMTQQGAGTNIQGAAQPYLGQSGNLTMDALGQSGAAAASPYMQQAAQNFPGNVDQYMDPYIGNVINRSADLANRNFTENLMPSIQDKFTRAGQYGSKGMLTDATRAARDTTENIQNQANAALSQAYQSAGQMFGADQSRQAGLAQLAGQLGSQQQNAYLQAAQQMGQLGSTAGQLAGQQGQLSLNAGQQMGNLGQMAQQLGLQGAGALDTIGQMQQGLNQKNLDTAYQDFLNQTNYPRQTIDWMSSVIRGLPAPTSTQTTTTGNTGTPGPSPLAQIGGALSGLAGLQSMFGKSGG